MSAQVSGILWVKGENFCGLSLREFWLEEDRVKPSFFLLRAEMFLLGLSRDRMLGRREWAVPF